MTRAFAPPTRVRTLQRSGTHWRYRERRGRKFDMGTNVDFPEGPGVKVRASPFLAVVFLQIPLADGRRAASPGGNSSTRRQVARA